MDYTIAETYELPSKGKIYKQNVSPMVTIRSMTTTEEMRRLSHTDYPYKALCDTIDACITEPIGISSYDMCLGDYQFLLHKLRVVTYGSNYPSSSICPICGKVNKTTLNLDDIKVKMYTEPVEGEPDPTVIVLPKTGRNIVLKYQTPRDLDEIAKEERDFKANNPDSEINISYLLTLKHLVAMIDGSPVLGAKLDIFLRNLPMADTNFLLKKATELNERIGLDNIILNKCSNPKCGVQYSTTFRITGEFFGPEV